MNPPPLKMGKGFKRLLRSIPGCVSLRARIEGSDLWLSFEASTDLAAASLAAHFGLPPPQETGTTSHWMRTSELAEGIRIEVTGPFENLKPIDQDKIDRVLAAVVPPEPEEPETEKPGEQIPDTGRSGRSTE